LKEPQGASILQARGGGYCKKGKVGKQWWGRGGQGGKKNRLWRGEELRFTRQGWPGLDQTSVQGRPMRAGRKEREKKAKIGGEVARERVLNNERNFSFKGNGGDVP